MNRFTILLAQKEQRTGKRYKQKDIADETGISTATVSRWINGEDVEHSSLNTVKKLCEWLDCDICELVYIEGRQHAELERR